MSEMDAPSAPGTPARRSRLARLLLRAPPAQGERGRPGGWTVFAAWGPCGFSPVAPGTVGTAGAVPLCWALRHAGWPAYLGVTLALLVLGVVAAQRAGRHWGVADASPIVVDEVVGYLVTMAFVPFTWPAAAAGFVLFRLLDVWKPWPASAFDRMKNGMGVMLDDLAAGVFGCLALHLAALGLRLAVGCGAPAAWCLGAG